MLHDFEVNVKKFVYIDYLRALWLFCGCGKFPEFCGRSGFWIKITVLNLGALFISEVRISWSTNYVLSSAKRR